MPSPQPVPRSIKMLLNEHAELRAMMRSILRILDRGPQDEPERFFDVLRAMLFFIHKFPECCHHPKESDFLFPHLLRPAPELFPTIEKLEQDHMQGESVVLPAATALFSDKDWKHLDAAFGASYAPFASTVPPHSHYDRLYFKIMVSAPPPIGVGRG